MARYLSSPLPLESRDPAASLDWLSPFNEPFRTVGLRALELASSAWSSVGSVSVREGVDLGPVLGLGRPGEVQFSSEWTNWNVSLRPPRPTQYDALTIFVHELGHAAGLGHSDFGVMRATIPVGTRRLPEVDLPGSYQSWWNGPVTVATSPTQTVVSPGLGGGPNVRSFDSNGNLTDSWYAMDPNWTGGVQSDTSGEVIVTGALSGGGPRVQIRVDRVVTTDFYAFGPSFRGGVNVAAGEGWIAIGAGTGGGPHVKIYDWNGTLLDDYFVSEPTSTTGVRFLTGDGQFHYVI